MTNRTRIGKKEGEVATSIGIDVDTSSSVPPGQQEVEEAKNLFNELGSRGLQHYSGIVEEEWLSKLKGNNANRAYKEMRDNDPIVGAIIYAIEMLARQVSWNAVPFDDSPEAEEKRQFLEECMEDMSTSWVDLISEILSMLPFGWSYHETVYKLRMGPNKDPSKNSKFNDGRIGWRKIPVRAQETLEVWDIAEDGGVKGMWQVAPPTYERKYIPIERALLFRTSTKKNNPQGRSILRNSYRSWFFKKRIEEIEGIGVERDLAGLPVCLAPSRIMRSEATPADKSLYNQLKKIVKSVRRDEQEGIIFPNDRDESGNPMFEFKLLNAGGSRTFDTSRIIERYDLRIALSVLADFILLGHEKVGSFALSSSKTALFSTALGSFLDSIAEVFNSYAIPRLFELNGYELSELPWIEHGDIETPNLQELGGFIGALAGAGMQLFPDDQLENALRDAAHLPRKVASEKDTPDGEDNIAWEGEEAESVVGEAVEGEPTDAEPVMNKEKIDIALSLVEKVKVSALSQKAAEAMMRSAGIPKDVVTEMFAE